MDLISPFACPLEDLPHLEEARKELMAELERRGQVALGALVPVLGLLWATLRGVAHRDHRIEWLLAAVLGVALLRAVSNDWRQGSPSARHLRFTAGSTLVAILLGAITWIAFPQLTPMEVGLLGMICAGLGSASLVSMAASPTTYLAYLLPIIGTLAVSSHLHPVPDHPVVYQSLAWLFLVSLAVLSLRVHSSLRNEILLRLRSRELSLRDTLTGLHNRRFLDEFMAHETAQVLRGWRREGTRPSLKLLMIDLDHFKQVNDEHGHEAGDAVLRQMADLLLETVRKPDIVVRWGGEEFVIVARDTSPLLPVVLAERIRRAVAAHAFKLPGGKELRRTCSIGFALFPFLDGDPDRLGWEQVVSLADTGLYLAKEEGRNRWVGLEAAAAWRADGADYAETRETPVQAEAHGLVKLIRT